MASATPLARYAVAQVRQGRERIYLANPFDTIEWLEGQLRSHKACPTRLYDLNKAAEAMQCSGVDAMTDIIFHKLYLSRQASGLYMLTALKPRKHRVGKTDHEDLYVRIGEPIGFRNMCVESVELLMPGFVHLRPLESILIEIAGRVAQ